MNEIPRQISKILTANDTGESGTHQAGMLIPKQSQILYFFPDLNCSEKNPRVAIDFEDDAGKTWKLHFIYYNNKFFDENGTRNEYRLTGMTAYFRENDLHLGDKIILTHLDSGEYEIRNTRQRELGYSEVVDDSGKKHAKLKIGSSWTVVRI